MSIGVRIVFFVAIVAMHIFIYFVLFRNLSDNPIIRHFGKAIIICNMLFIIIFLKLYHTNINPVLYTILSSSIGIFWIAFCVCVIALIVRLVILGFFGGLTLYQLSFWISIISCCFIAFFSVLSFYINSKEHVISRQEIAIKGLKESINIALLTDVHIDVLMDKGKVASLVDNVNGLNADIIALGGDVVDNYYDIVKDSVNELGRLRAKYGIYYVLGNHEYHYDVYKILDSLKSMGINTLLNQSITLNNIGINISGIADVVGYMSAFRNTPLAPNLDEALKNVNSNFPTILLSHQPKIIKYLSNQDISLILSGHTHGGQLFPFDYLVLLDQPFVDGLHKFRHGDRESQIFISRGVGWWGMPMRLFKRREINLLTLTPA